MKKVSTLVLLAVLSLSVVGCIKVYKPHPGAINTFDSVTYDAILDYKAALDEAKNQYSKGKLPPASKEYINVAVSAYNKAEESWKLYHGGDTTAANQLQKDVNAFGDSIAAIRTNFGGK